MESNRNKILVLLLLAVVLFFAIRKKKKKVPTTTAEGREAGLNAISNLKKYGVWDKVTADRIDTLHPVIREDVKRGINEATKQGLNLRITSGLRTFAEQHQLYQQGRTTGGSIVTNAAPGQSYHNYGLAFDVVPIVNGQAVWNNDKYWQQAAQIFKKLGFEWGGDFKSIKDKPHFQKSFGKQAEYYHNFVTSSNPYPKIKIA